MMDVTGLDIALTLPGIQVTVDDTGDGALIRWFQDGITPIANAEIRVLDDKRVEWTTFWVDFDHRGKGIFTRALELQDGWFAAHGLGPSVIARNANDADGYRQAGFVDEPGEGPYMVQDSERSAAWLEQRA